MKRWILWSASAIVGCLVACSSGTPITTGTGDGGPGSDGGDTDSSTNDGGTPVLPIATKDFDQTCTKDTDCALVTEGDVCAICSCANAAIAKTALDAYNTKRNQLSTECGPRPAIGCGVDCGQVTVTCSAAKKCVAGPPTVDGG
jgi:hypothetical protein